MILSNLLLSAWILNSHEKKDQKLYMTTLHLKLKARKEKPDLDAHIYLNNIALKENSATITKTQEL